MLALTRKKNESIMINNSIEVTVLEVKGEQVKIGISAPREIAIYRKEVYDQIKESNKESVIQQQDLTKLGELIKKD